MSIDRFADCYYLTCDTCGEDATEDFSEFEEAVAFKKNNGWKSHKVNYGWKDVCPSCQERKD